MAVSSKDMVVAQAAKPLTVAPSALKPQTKDLANRQVVSDLTSVNTGVPSITPVYSGKVIDFKPIPSKITITIENTNTSGGAIDINFLNNSTYVALPSGVTVTNSTGFSGKLLDKLIEGINQSDGLLIYGFNVTGYDASGVKSDAVLNNAQMELRYYNGYGTSYIPAQIDFSGAERNTQFKDGLLTVKVLAMLSWLMQVKVTLGQQETLQFVFFTQPLQD